MMEKRNCMKCGEPLLPVDGNMHLNPKRKFCNQKCRTRYNSLKRYQKVKDSEVWREQKKNYSAQWYEKNKSKQKKNVLKDYYKNKDRWRERAYVWSNREKIWDILGDICLGCGGKATRINHLTYNFPKRKPRTTGGLKQHYEYLKDYCKYLEPLCSNCHHSKKPSYNKETARLKKKFLLES